MLNQTSNKYIDHEINRILNSVCDDRLKMLTESIIPVFQITAIISNIFNAITLSSWKKARCLSISATVDSIQFFIHFLITQSFCLNDPNIVFKHHFQSYQLYVRSYLSRVVIMMSSLINIQIAVDRYYIIKNGYNLKSIKGRLFLFLLFSFLFYSPNLFIIKIYEIKNINIYLNNSVDDEIESSKYYVSYFTEFFHNREELKVVLIVIQHLITISYLIIMIKFNLLMFKDFKKSQKIYKNLLRIKMKHNSDNINATSNNNENEKCKKKDLQYKIRMKLLINWISCVFTIDQVLTSFGSPTYFFFQSSSVLHAKVLAITLLLRSIFSISNIIFYSIFYEAYRRTIRIFSWLLALFTILFNGCYFLLSI